MFVGDAAWPLVELLILFNDSRCPSRNFFHSFFAVLTVCRFLATGDSYKTIGYNYRVGDRSVSRIVENVCQALWNQLQPIYMCLPTEREWKQIAEHFMLKWQFPTVLEQSTANIYP